MAGPRSTAPRPRPPERIPGWPGRAAPAARRPRTIFDRPAVYGSGPAPGPAPPFYGLSEQDARRAYPAYKIAGKRLSPTPNVIAQREIFVELSNKLLGAMSPGWITAIPSPEGYKSNGGQWIYIIYSMYTPDELDYVLNSFEAIYQYGKKNNWWAPEDPQPKPIPEDQKRPMPKPTPTVTASEPTPWYWWALGVAAAGGLTYLMFAPLARPYLMRMRDGMRDGVRSGMRGHDRRNGRR